MDDLPKPGLYRATEAHPHDPDAIPAGALVYVGRQGENAFVVRPYHNEKNRWFWREPTTPMTDPFWAKTLRRLPTEGFYTLPEALGLESGGRWLKNAIVQLGYNRDGVGILFVAERRDTLDQNALYFSDRGVKIDDALLERLLWAPILPVAESEDGPLRH